MIRRRGQVATGAGSVTLITMIAMLGPSAQGLELTYVPHARSQMRVDDNIRSRAEDKESAWGFDIAGGVNLLARSPTLRSEIAPRVLVRRFVIGEDLDTEEYGVDFDNQWNMTENVLGTLDFAYARDSTLTNEITEDGLINDIKDRDSVSLAPSLQWAISDRWADQASFYYKNVAYIDAENTGLTDYNYMQATNSLSYAGSERVQLFGSVFVSQYRTPDLDGRARNVGGQAGATVRVSPTFTATGAAGYVFSEIKFVDVQRLVVLDPVPRFVIVRSPGEETTSGPLATVGLEKAFENGTASFDFVRQISPSGRGTQTATDEISARLVRRATERLSLTFVGRHQIRSSEGQERTAGISRNVSVLQGVANYRLDESWTVSASYRFLHREADRAADTITANANTIFLTLSFNGLQQPLMEF